MIQQELKDKFDEKTYPWAVFVVSILLNRTKEHTVRKVYPEFFKRWPTPEACLTAKASDIQEVIKSCGDRHGKAGNVLLMTTCWLEGRIPDCYPFVGDYGMDSYRLFVLKDGSVKPKARTLQDFWKQHFSPESS